MKTVSGALPEGAVSGALAGRCAATVESETTRIEVVSAWRNFMVRTVYDTFEPVVRNHGSKRWFVTVRSGSTERAHLSRNVTRPPNIS